MNHNRKNYSITCRLHPVTYLLKLTCCIASRPWLCCARRQALGTNIPQLQLSQQEEEQRLRDAAAAVAEGQLPASR